MGFTEGADYLRFPGDTSVAVASMIALGATRQWNTSLSFPDHTSITLAGVVRIDAGIFE